MDEKDIILEVKNLCTSFVSDGREVPIVRNVSLRLRRGTTLSVVGESGCGKSVTMNSILRFLGGSARMHADKIQYNALHDGKVTAHRLDRVKNPNGAEMRSLRGPELAMVFQDPMSSLNPVYRVGDQVAEGLRLHTGMEKKEARERVIALFRRLGIPDPEARIDAYPHEFSGGMKQRVVIAIAMICNPALIVCDEPTTALDVTIQAQIMELLKELQLKEGKSIVLITHNMGLVAEQADEVCVMYMGRVVEFGSLEDVFDHPSHPYTQALLRSVPVPGMTKDEKLQTIPGVTPDPASLGNGCGFAGRCPYALDNCRERNIPAFEISAGHTVRCLRFDRFPEVNEDEE